MNKHILLVMKLLRDNDSVTTEELKRNDADATDAYAAVSSASYDAYAAAARRVVIYFNRTGENRADYEAQLNKDAEMKEEVKAVYTQEMCDRQSYPELLQKFRVYGDEDCDDGYCYLTCVAYHVNGMVIAEKLDGEMLTLDSGFMPLDTRTDEEKLVDDICNTLSRSKTVVGYKGLAINLLQDFNITRKEK